MLKIAGHETKRAISSTAAKALDDSSWVLHKPRARGGVQKGQWALLRWLQSPPPGAATTISWAYDYGTNESYAGKVAGILESADYIARKASPNNRRLLQMELTAKGRALLRRDPLLHLARRLQVEYDLADFDRLGDLVGRVLEGLIASGISPSAATRRRTPGTVNEATTDDDPIDPDTKEFANLALRARATQEGRDLAVLLWSTLEDVYDASGCGGYGRNEWSALRFFADEGDATIAEFARAALMNSALASRAVSRLVNDGLIERTVSSAGEAKRASPRLTSSGIEALTSDPLNRLTDMLDETFEEAELANLTRLLKITAEAYDTSSQELNAADCA